MSDQKCGCQCSCEEGHGVLTDPDCVKCMRQKLRATCMVVFFRDEEGWRLGSYQGDKPSSEAEIEFYCMLNGGVPETIAGYENGFILNTASEIEQIFPKLKALFSGSSLIAAHVKVGEAIGVRLAWRDETDPFTEKELGIIQCVGSCPQGCEPVVL